MFGYNPHLNLTLGFIEFQRNYMTATSNPGVIHLRYRTPIEYENFVQAMGRLTRHYDGGAILAVSGVAQIAPLRFQPPKYTERAKMYDEIR